MALFLEHDSQEKMRGEILLICRQRAVERFLSGSQLSTLNLLLHAGITRLIRAGVHAGKEQETEKDSS
jgi:hypothetical protein